MRNLIYTFIALFITTASFAQNKAAVLDKLMSANNGDKIFTTLAEEYTGNIDGNKQADFKAEIAKKAKQYKAEAVAYFMKKYSQEDLQEIYTEFTDKSILNKSEKTNGFSREWRSYKGKFQKAFKEIYIRFQQ